MNSKRGTNPWEVLHSWEIPPYYTASAVVFSSHDDQDSQEMGITFVEQAA